MKQLTKWFPIAFLFFASGFAFAQADPEGQLPPVSQALVREGDLAIKLAERLRVGTPQDEAEAESMLASVGIAPKNGWIADYPVTPDIVGELQIATGEAADAAGLSMTADEASRAFQELAWELGLYVAADTGGETSGEETYRDVEQSYDPTIINNYYDTEGPPVVTYYPPPQNYYYLYAWVPYPFWGWGYFFPGFFILRDFHQVTVVNHRRCVVTNHWRDPRTRRMFVIDPEKRPRGHFPETRQVVRPRSFTSPEARRAASSIVERTRQGTRPGNRADPPSGRSVGKAPPALKSGSRIDRQTYHTPDGQSPQGRRTEPPRPPIQTPRASRASPQAGGHDVPASGNQRVPTAQSRTEPGFRGSSASSNRSVSPSAGSGSRSLSSGASASRSIQRSGTQRFGQGGLKM